MVPEFMSEVRSGGRDYVIRSQPKGLPEGVASLSAWIGFMALLRRWIRREKSWVVHVRAREHDPFGPVLYRDEAGSELDARQRVDAISRDIRSGQRPWVPADGD